MRTSATRAEHQTVGGDRGIGFRVARLIGLTLCGSALCVMGCDTPRPTGAPGRPPPQRLSDYFRGPTPEEAAALALDEFSADNRAIGVSLLSAEDFGGAGAYIDLYVDSARDEDAAVREAGIRALGRHGETTHAEILVEALSDENDSVRVAAARALQRIHSNTAVAPLIRATDPDTETLSEVRAFAAGALGQYRQRRVLQALIAALDDRELAVNHNARKSLNTLTGQDFGLELGAWLDWLEESENAFAGARVYEYPAYNRPLKFYEVLPFWPKPLNETPAPPVGYPRDLTPVVEPDSVEAGEG